MHSGGNIHLWMKPYLFLHCITTALIVIAYIKGRYIFLQKSILLYIKSVFLVLNVISHEEIDK